MAGRTLTISYVEGVIPGKWFRRWHDRMPRIPLESFQLDEAEQMSALDAGTADMSFVRSPPEPGDQRDRHMIPLYVEAAVVVMAKDHELSILDEIPDAELASRTLLSPELLAPNAASSDSASPSSGWKELIRLVATGAGIAIAPQSIARLYARKDVTYRPAADIEGTRIGLVWSNTASDADSASSADSAYSAGTADPASLVDAADSSDSPQAGMSREDVLQEFIGVVRGRTANSSRQPSAKRSKNGARRTGKAAGDTSRSGTDQNGTSHGGTNQSSAKRGSTNRGGTGRGGKNLAKRRPGRTGTRPAKRRRR